MRACGRSKNRCACEWTDEEWGNVEADRVCGRISIRKMTVKPS
jgi:hypothetical protein